PDIDEIHVDNEDVFLRAREFLRDVMPEKEEALRLYQGDKPIFSHFNVEQQIESIYKRRVPLKSGGSIVIDGTEALTAIDVNSGRSVRGGSQEETAFKTNIEAAVEIARQLRLRDLGGLIVIDFIDMRNPQHIGEVEKALRGAMFEDKARHEVGRISHFGLLEVSRQRLRPAAAATSYVACPMCDGHGLVRTTESAALVALRKIHNRIAQGDAALLKVLVPSDVAMYLLNQKREDLAQLERRYATRIQVVLSPDLMPHQSELEVKARVEGGPGEQPAVRLGGVALPAQQVASGEPEQAASAAPSETTEAAETKEAPVAGAPGNGSAASGERNVKRRRRRGRRRGRGKQAAAAIGEALAALASGTSLEQSASEHSAGTTFSAKNKGPEVAEIAATRSHDEPPMPAESGSAEGAEHGSQRLRTQQPIEHHAKEAGSAAQREEPASEATEPGAATGRSSRRRRSSRPTSRKAKPKATPTPTAKASAATKKSKSKATPGKTTSAERRKRGSRKTTENKNATPSEA
ncbi:MAG: ribonuclease E/G, partial [Deltaproteobacteria bacterium]|nr:ribonuclease E/G [Deltaproteobacteria bacterium]